MYALKSTLSKVTCPSPALPPPPPKYLNSPNTDTGKFKLYNFKSQNTPDQAFVIANSRQSACDYLISQKHVEPKGFIENYFNDIVDSMIELRNGYSLESYNVGEVLFTEN